MDRNFDELLVVINFFWDKVIKEGRERKKGEREEGGMGGKKERISERKEGNYLFIFIEIVEC